MSVFHYPRINFSGRLRLNPGTANNDDYAQPGSSQALMPSSFGDRAGQPMGLLESTPVQVDRYGLSDHEFVEWIQQAQEFDTPDGATEAIMPSEWNYYGDMSSTAVGITVVGVTTAPGRAYVEPCADEPLTEVLGATLGFYGNITDVNPEGSPPATQFFVEGFELASPHATFISGGQVSKGVGLWINFYRNVNLVEDDGSGSYVYHVVTGADVALPGFEEGIVMRYYISLPLLDDPATARPEVLEDYYRNRRQNPKTLDVVGTLAPYHAGEPIAMPPGRQLISRQQDIPTSPKVFNNGDGNGIALAPAVASQHGSWLSVDFSGSFPDAYVSGRVNPKFDFGPVALQVVCDGDSTGQRVAEIGSVDYLDAVRGDAQGWLFDFDLTAAADGRAAALLDRPDARLQLESTQLGTVLDEVDYYVVTDQLAVYAEQHGRDDEFLSQGVDEPISVSVYHRGERLEASECPPIHAWQYRSAPIQRPGPAVAQSTPLRPGEPITVSTAEAGAYLLTFHVEGERNPPAEGFPPANYGSFAYPPTTFVVTWAPQISVRVLPADDYSEYFVDPAATEPEANDLLTWDVVYSQVLRTYALLFPAMNNKIALDDQEEVARFAPYIIEATSRHNWRSVRYMPPTRDLSHSRRQLLHAWCRKVGATMPSPQASTSSA